MSLSKILIASFVLVTGLAGCGSGDGGSTNSGTQTGNPSNPNPANTGGMADNTPVSPSGTIFRDAFLTDRVFVTSGTLEDNGTLIPINNIRFEGKLNGSDSRGNISNNSYTFEITGTVAGEAFATEYSFYLQAINPLQLIGQASFEDVNNDGSKDVTRVLRFSDVSPIPASVPAGTNQNFGTFQVFSDFVSGGTGIFGTLSYSVSVPDSDQIVCLRGEENSVRSGVKPFEEFCFKLNSSSEISGLRLNTVEVGSNGTIERVSLSTPGF